MLPVPSSGWVTLSGGFTPRYITVTFGYPSSLIVKLNVSSALTFLVPLSLFWSKSSSCEVNISVYEEPFSSELLFPSIWILYPSFSCAFLNPFQLCTCNHIGCTYEYDFTVQQIGQQASQQALDFQPLQFQFLYQ